MKYLPTNKIKMRNILSSPSLATNEVRTRNVLT